MATSSITANFAIRDEKEAKAFISTLLPDSRVDHFGYLDTERFVVMTSRFPEDYTSWHQRHFANEESVCELGEKIKAIATAKRQNAIT